MIESAPDPVQPEVIQQPAPADVTGNIPSSPPAAQPSGLRALLASKPRDPCVIFKGEHYWRDRSLWLKEQGYVLRPRYSPDWKPSWVGTSKHRMDCEDSRSIPGVCTLSLPMYIIHVVDNAVTARPCLGRNTRFRRIRGSAKEDITEGASLRGGDWSILVVRDTHI